MATATAHPQVAGNAHYPPQTNEKVSSCRFACMQCFGTPVAAHAPHWQLMTRLTGMFWPFQSHVGAASKNNANYSPLKLQQPSNATPSGSQGTARETRVEDVMNWRQDGRPKNNHQISRTGETHWGWALCGIGVWQDSLRLGIQSANGHEKGALGLLGDTAAMQQGGLRRNQKNARSRYQNPTTGCGFAAVAIRISGFDIVLISLYLETGSSFDGDVNTEVLCTHYWAY